MSGLTSAIATGAVFSLIAGLGLLALLSAGQAWAGGLPSRVWRWARWGTLLPLGIAPLVYLTPVEPEPLAHTPLGGDFPVIAAPTAPLAASPSLWSQITQGFETLLGLLPGLYLAGLLIMAVLAVARHVWRRDLIAESRAPLDAERSAYDRAAALVDTPAPDFRVTDRNISPMLTGWRGIVLAPQSLFTRPETARFALVHELVHVRRGDERDRLIGAALITLAWFHWPLRQIERQLDAARERDCDREVLGLMGGSARKPYAKALVTVMRDGMQPASAFGPSDKRNREMRIRSIIDARQTPWSSRILIAALAAISLAPLAWAQVQMTERARVAPEILAPEILPVAAIEPQPTASPRATARSTPSLQAVPASYVTAASGASLRAPLSPEPVADAAPVPQAIAQPRSVPEAEEAPCEDEDARHELRASAPDLTHRIVQGRVSSQFGHRPSRPAGAPVFHQGIDIAAPLGTPIKAPAAGVVSHAEMGFGGSDRWGNTVVIDHGDGWQTVYAHMHYIGVEVGDQVAAGDKIGKVGATGAATGPHVHVELRHNGERIDPAGYLPGIR